MYQKADYKDFATLKRNIQISQGAVQADTVIKNVSYLDVFTGVFRIGDVALHGEHIVGIQESYAGKHEVDGTNLFLTPGFIDSHVHIESSLMTPGRYEQFVLPKGTTTAIWDPHEIANVKGSKGIQWAIEATEDLLMDILIMIPSCVPSTNDSLGLETSGSELLAEDLLPFAEHPRVLGLAELMNYPALLAGDTDILSKLLIYKNKKRDGHCPNLSGRQLNAYGVAGIHSCHESTSLEEAAEKMSKGIHVIIREGSCAKNADVLLPLLNSYTSAILALCSDDRNPLDIEEEGHINFIIEKALSAGIKAEHIFRSASFGSAKMFGLDDRGAIAPGYLADLCLVKQKEKNSWNQGFEIINVFKKGSLSSSQQQEKKENTSYSPFPGKNINMGAVSSSSFKIGTKNHKKVKVRAIAVIPGQILTNQHIGSIDCSAGEVQSDVLQDLLKIAVVERHHNTGNCGIGFVKGFQLKEGAIVSSINHDSHNIIVVGASDQIMAEAVNKLREIDGGILVWRNSSEWECLPLPIGGLMTNINPSEIAASMMKLKKLTKKLGCSLHEPFLQLSFLALPVIPSLKITDKGLVDVESLSIIPPIV